MSSRSKSAQEEDRRFEEEQWAAARECIKRQVDEVDFRQRLQKFGDNRKTSRRK